MRTQIFLIKRKLNRAPIMNKYYSHSALLIQNEEDSFILEYGSNYDGEVRFRRVLKPNDTVFHDGEHRWHKHGSYMVNKDPETIKNIMSNVTKEKKYNVLTWNCHIAVHKTLNILGHKNRHVCDV